MRSIGVTLPPVRGGGGVGAAVGKKVVVGVA